MYCVPLTSPDPILNKYLPNAGKEVSYSLKREPHWMYQANLLGMGGVFNSGNLGLYTYTHQSPVRYVDPDGEKIRFAKGSTTKFKKQFAQVINYLNKGKASGVISQLEKRPEVILIKEGKNHTFQYDSNTKTIEFDPTSGLTVGKGKTQTPALGVLHEASHALQDVTNSTPKRCEHTSRCVWKFGRKACNR